MSRLSLLLVLAACSLRPHDFGADATDTGAGTSTTATTGPTPTTGPPVPATTTSSTTSSAASSSTGSTGQPFIVELDGGSGTKDCDPFIDDCPEGQKCAPYTSDGDSAWDSLKCVPLVRDPAGVGEPCTVLGGPASGEDTCDEHMMCWYVDPETGLGVCVAKCSGSPDDPQCEDPAAFCLFTGEVLNLCLKDCSPLLQDCPHESDICVPDPDGLFVCTVDASGDEGQAFDPCDLPNGCDPGLLCAAPELAAECDPMAPGCCLPLCDITVMPASCPGVGQQCLPWHDEGQAPPGLENVGICGLPM